MTRVKKIKFHNIMGFEDFEFEPGAVTIIRGRNGTGKTSALEGVKAAIGGGNDVTLVRAGEEEGEAYLLLDNDVEIDKLIRTDGRGKLKVTHPDFGVMGAPQSWLDGIADVVAFNPVALIHARPKDRTRLVLEAIPMELEVPALQDALGDHPMPDVDVERHALEVLADVRKAVFDERTGINRVKDEKEKSASQLRESLPADELDPEKLSAELEETDRSLRQVIAARDAQKSAADEARQQKLQHIETNLQRQIDELKEAADRDRSLAHDIHRQRLESIDEDHDEAITGLRGQEATLKERLRTAERSQSAVELLTETEAAVVEYSAQSEALTEVIGRLDALRIGLEAEIPLEGVTIRDGEMYVDEVPFERVNTARQVRIAVELAKLRAGELALVCVDRLECLDPETFELFVDELAASGLQALVTRVSEHAALDIETREPAVAAGGVS